MAAVAVVNTAAQEELRILRLPPNGAGEWEARQNARIQYYYRSKTDAQVAAGGWLADGFSNQLRKATHTQLIYILAGSATFEDNRGHETMFKAGDAVLLPRGAEYAWKRTNNHSNYWVVFDRAGSGLPAPQAEPKVFRLESNGPTGLAANKDGRTKQHTYFQGPDGSSVGVWETQPYMAPGFHRTTYAELMMFLKGNATLSTPDGQVEHFKAGDVALVPKGIEYKWSSDTVRKYFVIFDADSAPGPTAVP
jgi:uncharacterized cupin superfamily protein